MGGASPSFGVGGDAISAQTPYTLLFSIIQRCHANVVTEEIVPARDEGIAHPGIVGAGVPAVG